MNRLLLSATVRFALFMSNCCMVVLFGLALLLGAVARAQRARAVLPSSVRDETECSRILSPYEILSPAQSVVSTLTEMYNQGDLTLQQLITIRNGQNPLLHKHSVAERLYVDVVTNVVGQLRRNCKGRERLDELIRTIEAKKSEQKVRTVETSAAFQPMTIYYLPGGAFEVEFRKIINFSKSKRTVRGFYAANIPVTQWQYAFVMRDSQLPNPSHFKTGYDARDVRIGDRKIHMRPNNPIESLSVDDAQRFIQVLNDWSKTDNPLIYKIISNHIQHARIRLLSEVEWEYLATHGGEWKNLFPDGVSQPSLREFEWYLENSGGSTHPVAERQPLIIFNHPFYDLFGNVLEWTIDSRGWTRASGGGSWNTNERHLWISFRLNGGHGYVGSDQGFRLAEDPP